MKEKAVDKRMASCTVDIEICKKAEKLFRRTPEDSLSQIYARALEEATRDVKLSPDELEEVAAEIRANQVKREKNRNKAK